MARIPRSQVEAQAQLTDLADNLLTWEPRGWEADHAPEGVARNLFARAYESGPANSDRQYSSVADPQDALNGSTSPEEVGQHIRRGFWSFLGRASGYEAPPKPTARLFLGVKVGLALALFGPGVIAPLMGAAPVLSGIASAFIVATATVASVIRYRQVITTHKAAERNLTFARRVARSFEREAAQAVSTVRGFGAALRAGLETGQVSHLQNVTRDRVPGLDAHSQSSAKPVEYGRAGKLQNFRLGAFRILLLSAAGGGLIALTGGTASPLFQVGAYQIGIACATTVAVVSNSAALLVTKRAAMATAGNLKREAASLRQREGPGVQADRVLDYAGHEVFLAGRFLEGPDRSTGAALEAAVSPELGGPGESASAAPAIAESPQLRTNAHPGGLDF